MPTVHSHRPFFLSLQVLRFTPNVFCSAGTRAVFADSEKKPQVFRKQRGSPALQNETDPFLGRGFFKPITVSVTVL
jgi:hypothetical protein